MQAFFMVDSFCGMRIPTVSFRGRLWNQFHLGQALKWFGERRQRTASPTNWKKARVLGQPRREHGYQPGNRRV